MSLLSSPVSSSESSFDMLSSSHTDSDDEIVWPISAHSAEDDYVLITPQAVVSPDLVSSFSHLSLSTNGRPKPGRNNNKASSPIGLGARPIVDDISEAASVIEDETTSYEDAVTYITTFLTNPAHDSASHLTFLQSLIIELGLATPSLPNSLKSAKAVLKSKAFLNIRDYLAVRQQGLKAIQDVMYPSRTALIKSIKKGKKNTASLHWVKQAGLQALLVSCYH